MDVGSKRANIRFPAGTKLSALISAFDKSARFSATFNGPVTMKSKSKGIEASATTDAASYAAEGSGSVTLDVSAAGTGFAAKKEGDAVVKVTLKPSKNVDIEETTLEHGEAVEDGSNASFTIPFALGAKAKGDLGIQVTIEATTEGGKKVKTKTVIPILVN